MQTLFHVSTMGKVYKKKLMGEKIKIYKLMGGKIKIYIQFYCIWDSYGHPHLPRGTAPLI